jgi:hypothetical protein
MISRIASCTFCGTIGWTVCVQSRCAISTRAHIGIARFGRGIQMKARITYRAFWGYASGRACRAWAHIPDSIVTWAFIDFACCVRHQRITSITDRTLGGTIRGTRRSRRSCAMSAAACVLSVMLVMRWWRTQHAKSMNAHVTMESGMWAHARQARPEAYPQNALYVILAFI